MTTTILDLPRPVDDGTAPIHVVDAGSLHMPTGRLIAADPGLLYGDAAPLAEPLPAGTYPVQLAVARPAFGPERAVAAMLRIVRRRSVLFWERALLEHEAVAGPGYPARSGFGCFLDAAALDPYTNLGDEPVDEYELLVTALAEHAAAGRVAAAEFPLGSGLNMVAFTATTRAAAACPTWLGRDAAGRVVAVVTDFRETPDRDR